MATIFILWATGLLGPVIGLIVAGFVIGAGLCVVLMLGQILAMVAIPLCPPVGRFLVAHGQQRLIGCAVYHFRPHAYRKEDLAMFVSNRRPLVVGLLAAAAFLGSAYSAVSADEIPRPLPLPGTPYYFARPAWPARPPSDDGMTVKDVS